ncbi:MAG: OmpA family protein [Clostridiales bacterium]|nr:OmpA family protein [Clostridiales bacterium]
MRNCIFKTIASMCVVIAMLSSGCAKRNSSTAAPKAVSFVIGNRACVSEINLNNDKIREKITEVIESQGFISIIQVDGNPEVIASDLYTLPDALKNANSNRLNRYARDKTNMALQCLVSARADDEEADLLAALELAVRSLRSSAADMQKTIVVLDSGISTCGAMDFRGNLIEADPSELANLLSERRAIPDFSGITVVFQQLGDTALPQEKLTLAQTEQLKAIWKCVIQKTGGEPDFDQIPANPDSSRDDFPKVSTVTFPDETPIVFEKCVIEQAVEPFAEPVFLAEDQIKFQGDSWEYVDPDAAEKVLDPVAAYMKSNPSFRILLIGCCAGDSNSSYSVELSLARANKVKETLVSLGISDDRILTIGQGSADRWHIYGAGTSGPIAASNRKVVLLDADSLTAKQILEE